MATAVPLNRPAAEPDRIAALEAQVAELSARLAEFEVRLPRKPLALPNGWPVVKQAAHDAGVSQAKVYRAISDGVIFAVQVGQVTIVHPDDVEKLKTRLSRAVRASC